MAKSATFGDRMAALKNGRQERYAQLIAEGKTQQQAYKEAGYRPNPGNPTRLKDNERVAERIAYFQETAAQQCEITVSSVTQNLLRIGSKAEDLSDSAGLSVARLAHMDCAKLAGLITDKAKLDVGLTLHQALDALAGPDED